MAGGRARSRVRDRQHWIANPHLEAIGGLAAFAIGWALLYDAFDRRGREQPRLMRPITWW